MCLGTTHLPFVGVHVEVDEPQAIGDRGVGGTLQWRQLLVALIGRESCNRWCVCVWRKREMKIEKREMKEGVGEGGRERERMRDREFTKIKNSRTEEVTRAEKVKNSE